MIEGFVMSLNRNASATELQGKLIDGVHAEVGSRTVDDLAAERDEILLGLLELRLKPTKAKQPA
jgi:hypothetical protein